MCFLENNSPEKLSYVLPSFSNTLKPNESSSDQISGPAIFLDRDGVLIWSFQKFIKNPNEAHLISGAIDALSKLSRQGYKLVLVTNQSGIGTGKLTWEEVKLVNTYIQNKVTGLGGKIDGIYVCPHKDSEDCTCRKPSAEMIIQAATDLSIDLTESFLVGDQMSDILAARKAGVKPILCLTGRGLLTFLKQWNIRTNVWVIIPSIADLPAVIENAHSLKRFLMDRSLNRVSRALAKFNYRYRYPIALFVTTIITLLTVAVLFDLIPWTRLGSTGYIGIFFVNIINGACFVFGGPAQVLTFLAAKNLFPLLVGVIGGIGTSIGELSGFFLGRTGIQFIGQDMQGKIDSLKHSRIYNKLHQHTFLTLFIIALIPNPTFDPVTILCGALRFKFQKYFFPILAGKVARFIIIAYFGSWFFSK